MYPLIILSENIQIPTYFLSFALVFTLSVLWFLKRAQAANLPYVFALDLSLIVMIGGFLGSRLFHVIYEMPEHYREYPLEIFYVWQGGFVFYGGVLGAIVPSWLYLRSKKQFIPQWLDVIAPIPPLAYAFGRLATLLSGSGYGHPTELPWGLIYPPGSEAPSGIALHPTPIYAFLYEMIVALLVLYALRLKKRKQAWFYQSGQSFYLFMMLHGLGRAIMEQFRGDFRGDLLLGWTVSTWLSIGLILWGLHLFLQNLINCLKNRAHE